MSIASHVIKAGNALRESVDSVQWLQSQKAPHNYFDPTATRPCPDMPAPNFIKRLFMEHQALAKCAPEDLFPITRMEPALCIGSSAAYAGIDAVPPPLHHLLCYWRVDFVAPRRPLIINGTLHPPQVWLPCCPRSKPRTALQFHSF
jgi:hypothetical protein